MKLGLFRSWETSNLAIIVEHHPFIPDIYPVLVSSKTRLDLVMGRYSIIKNSYLGHACLAFYLGIISGVIRSTINTARLDNPALVHLILTSYGYLTIKSGKVKSDHDWVMVIARADETLSANEYAWYHRKGISTAGIWGENAEQSWLAFESKIRASSSER